jgi:hypothetical protein
MTRSSTRRNRRECSLLATNTMDRNRCWSAMPEAPRLHLWFQYRLGGFARHPLRRATLVGQSALQPHLRKGVRMNSWSSPLGGSAKNRNSRRDAALHEIRRFERPRAAQTRYYDDDVGRCEWFVDDERPSCGSQNLLPNGGNSNDGSRGQRIGFTRCRYVAFV